MSNGRYWRYFKYCLLILCYGISIIIYTSPSSIPPEIFMSIHIRELFNEIIRMAMVSIAIHIIVAVLAIGAICALKVIFNKFENHSDVSIIKELSLVRFNNFRKFIDVLNPFLYGSKTRCLLE